MSNSQNKKNEQQNNLCTTLTEQWKKGELEQGYYYTKYNPKVGEPFVEIELRNYLLDLAKVRDADTVEVLAPVPSYKEWQELKEFADYSLHNRDELTRQINFWMDKHTQIEKENAQLIKFLEEFNALDVAKENQQLKELLLKCKYPVMLASNNATDETADEYYDLWDEIENVIGEKK